MLLQGPKLALVDFQFQLNFSWLKWLSMIPAVDIYIYINTHKHTQVVKIKHWKILSCRKGKKALIDKGGNKHQVPRAGINCINISHHRKSKTWH